MKKNHSQNLFFLYSFIGIISLLIIIGFLFIYSSSSVFALEKHGTAHYFFRRQLIGFFLGLLGLLILAYFPTSFIYRSIPFIFLSSIMLTLLTFAPGLGISIHGSHRWLNLIAGFAFQPSELLKISFLAYIAYTLSYPYKKRQERSLFFYLITILIFLCALLLKQPDFGMAATIAISTILLFFVLNIETYYLALTSLAGACAGLILIYMKSYRWKRILTFFNPWNDPQGAGFQLIQSLIAIGSGGLYGVGIAQSKQKFFYLPMQHTDFIVAIIAEETGFLGMTVLILIYLLFTYFGLSLAWRMPTPFGTIFCLGFVILTSLQAVINIGVTTGMLPTKGIGLPFVSYGSSSLIAFLFGLGLIINCAKNSSLGLSYD